MKHIKMLGVAAGATVALMAFVGASSASGTVLCKTPGTGTPTGTTCPEGWAYPTGTTTHEVNEGVVKLTTEFKNIECSKSEIEIETENLGSETETVRGQVKKLTFQECNCEVKTLNNGTQEFHWISGTHNGTITSTESEVTAQCSSIFGNVHCIYSTNATDVGDVTAGAEATVDIEGNDIPRLTTNELCAEEATWDGKYKVESPKPLYFATKT